MSFSLDIQDARIGVIGLGYVGLPLAVALGREFPTLGYDRNSARVAELGARRDSTGESDAAELASATLLATSSTLAFFSFTEVFDPQAARGSARLSIRMARVITVEVPCLGRNCVAPVSRAHHMR